jgi:hypothetical protein
MSVESPEQGAPEQPTSDQQTEIVAGPGRSYRIKHYVLVAVLIAAGAWFAYDGFVKYPAQNRAADAKGQPRPHGVGPHGGYGEWDIPSNVALGIALPPLGIALLLWTLYFSRGVYRLAGNTLHIPGHPPIPLDAICRIDKKQWDKKGIAYIEYELPGAERGRFRFDDYLYDREPADRIFEIIEKHAQAMAEA